MPDPEKWEEYLMEWVYNAEKAGLKRPQILVLMAECMQHVAIRIEAERQLNG